MYFPAFDEVLSDVRDALIGEELLIEIVNSEQDVDHLLDKSGRAKITDAA